MKIKPLGNRVLVEEVVEETSKFVVIPKDAKEKSQKGKVIAVGEGKYEDGKKIPMEVKVGDEILFSKYGGDEIKVKGKELKILSQDDILAIFEK